MMESIQQAVLPHDRYQIELKLDYELHSGKQTHYQVETYIFAPRTLAISEETYPKRYFYSDLKNYIRFKTPTLILRDFDTSKDSPLHAIRTIIQQSGWVTDPRQIKPLVEQLKLLAAMLKSAIREHIDHLRVQLEHTSGGNAHRLCDNLIQEFLSATHQISQSYDNLLPEFSLPNIDESILTGYTFTDESISVLLEEGLIELLGLLDEYQLAEMTELKELLRSRIHAEVAHRREKGYESLLDTEGDNELYNYRVSILKKYASSILYLSTSTQREGQKLEHFAQAIAAGIAMIFATTIAFYFQWRFGNFTFPFFVALVVGYMFKDRVKEIGRGLFMNTLHNFIYDRRIAIYTQDKKHQIGILREKVSFISEDELPRRIHEARDYDTFVQIENDRAGETIIRYTKDIVLFADAIREIMGAATQITSINDIIRYDIRSFLSKMDDPIQDRLMLKDDELITVPTHKVYHINLISKYAARAPKKDKVYRRHRVILNRSGIKRIEGVSI